MMGWTQRKLTPRFGMELSGQRLDDPDLPQAERDAVLDAVCAHGVVLVSGQDLSDEAMLAFASSIGVVMEGPGYASDDRVPVGQKVFRLTNLDDDGNILPDGDWMVRQNKGNELWHIDSTYMKPKHHISLFYGKVCPPEGANTEYCDLRLAWEALTPEEQTFLEGRIAAHSLLHSRKLIGFDEWSEEDVERFSPVDRPLIGADASGRKALWIASHILSITGMDYDAAIALVADLTRRAAAPERCYSHKWRAGDLLIWDNRAVMHRATPFAVDTYARDMRTCRLVDLEDA
jgi:alpha-ketoglutarate-dependent 2,4-dichlorophenoxyacetate dioxygenase